MEHKRRLERKREEKEIEAKKERVRKAREAAQKARKVGTIMECHSVHLALCSSVYIIIIHRQFYHSFEVTAHSFEVILTSLWLMLVIYSFPVRSAIQT